ncbi:TetR family transcriptional regulator C-terminal domain-containing protein [Pseudonocardia sp. S2-4]|uniref:TetR family transcriptional regulator C-terminal domain-containing protein n=1 Tax=Pseudonocardia humida TaxID=2800819 RepID=A0ABT1A5N8_9PSEU|nr:TetR family transcriptional regulator C-terminal domain-containing protein [Pseudonocardia humida]
MPKKVDHEARRREIAEAVLRLAAADGLESVSLRQVAAEAGISMGAVQHYFRTKDDMLGFALEHLARRREDRITARLSAGGAVPTVRELVRVSALEVLPTDEPSRADYLAGIAFFIRALREPRTAGLLTEGAPKLYDFFAGQLLRAQAAGELAEGADPYREVVLLWSMVDGQSSALLLGECSAEDAVATIEYHLDRLFLPVEAPVTMG